MKHKNEHYIGNRTIEPWDVVDDWGLSFYEGNVLKYLSRWNRKGDPIGDLDKLIHYAMALRERVQNSQPRQLELPFVSDFVPKVAK